VTFLSFSCLFWRKSFNWFLQSSYSQENPKRESSLLMKIHRLKSYKNTWLT